MTVQCQSLPSKQDRESPPQSSMIGRRTAVAMILAFAGLIGVPPVHQLCTELNRTGRWRFLDLFERVPTHASLKQFEETLARESVLSSKARLFYREFLMRRLGQGNEKIVVGRNGFLFFLQEVEMAAGPGILRRRPVPVRGIDGTAQRVLTDAAGSDRRLRSPASSCWDSSRFRTDSREALHLSGAGLARVSGRGRAGLEPGPRRLQGQARGGGRRCPGCHRRLVERKDSIAGKPLPEAGHALDAETVWRWPPIGSPRT